MRGGLRRGRSPRGGGVRSNVGATGIEEDRAFAGGASGIGGGVGSARGVQGTARRDRIMASG